MIINNFLGGLGNQMFQIATAFAHSQRVGSQFAINYELGIGFGQGFHHKKYKDNLYSKIPSTSKNFFIPYQEPQFNYSPIPKVDGLCLVGYYQSEKYFLDYKRKILELFYFPQKIQKKNL